MDRVGLQYVAMGKRLKSGIYPIMAVFLTTKGIAAELENIIREAKWRIILISPYLQVSEEYISRLDAAANRGVQISVVFRENKVSETRLADLEQIPRIGLRCLENLHAKCYCNEVKILISSMNLYEHSELHNTEMGILLGPVLDADAFKNASQEIEDIRGKARLFNAKTSETIAYYPAKMITSHVKSQKSHGYCIRCNATIPYDLGKPLCKSCYNTWSHYCDPEFVEDFCHTCGNPDDTSMSRPECYNCYSSHKDHIKPIGRTG